MSRVVLVTAIQEKLDRAYLTVRIDRRIVGYVYQDQAHKWVARTAPPPPEQVVRGDLQTAVEWLCDIDSITPEPVTRPSEPAEPNEPPPASAEQERIAS